jgi:hypothetical protein
MFIKRLNEGQLAYSSSAIARFDDPCRPETAPLSNSAETCLIADLAETEDE